MKLWIVMSIKTERVFGPFDSEAQGINWAKGQNWPRGWMVRAIESI